MPLGNLYSPVLRPSIAVLALVATLAACGSDDDATATTARTSVATTTTMAPATTTTAMSTREVVFGWLRSFVSDAGATTVAADTAEMLNGEAAVAAAREDGVIGADEDLPNDYYIRNPDESTTEFTVSPDVVVTLQACYDGGECVTTEEVDLDTWSVLLGGEDDPGLDWDWYGAGQLPYDFTVEAGVIVEVQEVYLP
ncbi:MAG: hypothetical protein OEP52_02580 [Acidimicrobiia bacterium]|nr:hypothetical protein [Acidimicrobiia bacterium]